MPSSIYDIARAAGCSISTVSKALNDHYSIAEETKRRVRAVAEELHYQPSARARSFASRKSGTALFVSDFYRNIGYENPHMFEIINGATHALEEKGYSLLLRNMRAADAPALLRDAMLREQADGVLLHATILTKQLAMVLMKADLPYLVIGRPGFSTGVSWMDVNHESAGRLAADYLLDRGYRRVAFLLGNAREDIIAQSRLKGMNEVFAEEALSVETLPGCLTYEEGARAAEALLDRAERPEVIVCTSNTLAVGCLHALRARGVDIPGGMALMTFDNYPFSMIVQPQITAVDLDMYDMGWEAARFLLRRIHKPNLQTQSFCTTPRLIARDST